MSTFSEIEAIRVLDEALSQLDDDVVRTRVLKWAWDKYSAQSSPLPDSKDLADKSIKKKKKVKSPAKSKMNPSIVKNLILNPEGEMSFRDFVQQKQPGSNYEKCTVAIYYLQHIVKIDGITINHVFTCFKDANWRVIDLYNSLASTASRKGWIDTSNMEKISITPRGETQVEHDLPKQDKQQK